jgi:multisubunit Na+/H+ antiporter MnhF subunit
MKGAGGTNGGFGEFLAGFVMAVAGGWLLTNQVMVTSGFWGWFGPHTFGLSLLPLVVGAGFLFFDGRSVIGRVLTVAGATIILAGILANMRIYFERTSLFNTLVMLVLLAGGLGLMARGLRAKE